MSSGTGTGTGTALGPWPGCLSRRTVELVSASVLVYTQRLDHARIHASLAKKTSDHRPWPSTCGLTLPYQACLVLSFSSQLRSVSSTKERSAPQPVPHCTSPYLTLPDFTLPYLPPFHNLPPSALPHPVALSFSLSLSLGRVPQMHPRVPFL